MTDLGASQSVLDLSPTDWLAHKGTNTAWKLTVERVTDLQSECIDWQNQWLAKCLIYYTRKWLGKPTKKQKQTNKPKGNNVTDCLRTFPTPVVPVNITDLLIASNFSIMNPYLTVSTVGTSKSK